MPCAADADAKQYINDLISQVGCRLFPPSCCFSVALKLETTLTLRQKRTGLRCPTMKVSLGELRGPLFWRSGTVRLGL